MRWSFRSGDRSANGLSGSIPPVARLLPRCPGEHSARFFLFWKSGGDSHRFARRWGANRATARTQVGLKSPRGHFELARLLLTPAPGLVGWALSHASSSADRRKRKRARLAGSTGIRVAGAARSRSWFWRIGFGISILMQIRMHHSMTTSNGTKGPSARELEQPLGRNLRTRPHTTRHFCLPPPKAIEFHVLGRRCASGPVHMPNGLPGAVCGKAARALG